MTAVTEQEWYTVADLAIAWDYGHLFVHPEKRIRQLINDGQIRAVRVGNRWLIHRTAKAEFETGIPAQRTQ